MTPNLRHAPPLPRPTSFFLDLLRLAAALSVFFVHVVQLWYPDNYSIAQDHFGERAVIVFFVLSGYVIAYSTLRRERDPRSYVLARLSRLYSVVLPALALTAFLQAVGTALNPTVYHLASRGHDALRYGVAALFLQSVWFTSSAPPTNGPFWSLCHEFWYYAIFGAAVLIPRWRWKLTTILGCALVCGPNVLLLMPSWLLGVACYGLSGRSRLGRAPALAGLLLALALTAASYRFLPDWPCANFNMTLLYASPFLTDLIFGLLVALVIWFFDQAFRAAAISARLEASVRWLADHTFSLYLYHFPLLFFLAAVVPFNLASAPAVAGMILLTLGLVLGLSLLTESKRPAWRRFFARIWDRWALGPARTPA